MSAPRGILKNSTPYVHSAPKAGGSKLKHTVAVAQRGNGSSRGSGAGSSASKKDGKRSKSKKARLEADADEDEDVDMDGLADDDDEEGEGAYEGQGDEEEEEDGTDEEIERSKKGKTKATPKRKRPTTAEDFGSALQSLLTESSRPTKSKPSKSISIKTADVSSTLPTTSVSTPGPSNPAASAQTQTQKSKSKPSAQLPILSLSRAPLPPSAAESKLERRAARALRKEKEDKEDRARVRDVVEGWSHPKAGPGGELVGAVEFEKGLRKTAQRGVIKLFNAILTAHKQSAENDIEIRSTKRHKEQPISGIKGFGKRDKDNVLGRGNKEELTKEGFLELVKRGTA